MTCIAWVYDPLPVPRKCEREEEWVSENETGRKRKSEWEFLHLSVSKKLNTFPLLSTLPFPLFLLWFLSSGFRERERERERVSTESVRCQVVRIGNKNPFLQLVKYSSVTALTFYLFILSLPLSLYLSLPLSFSHSTPDWGKEEKSETSFLVTVLDSPLSFLI